MARDNNYFGEFIDIDALELENDIDKEELEGTQIFCSCIEFPEIKAQDISKISQEETPVLIAMGNEINMIMSRVMDRMPAREAECIALSFYGGNPSLTEMAKHFNISLPRMHQLKKQAMKNLRSHKGLKEFLLAG